MLYYPGASEEDAANLFESEGTFYLLKPCEEDLFELPDLHDDPRNLQKLGGAPEYHGLQLVPVGPAEISGGRRSLDGTTVPEGWKQLPWDPTVHVVGLPARCYRLEIAAVISTADGTRHVIEADYEYYLSFEPEKVVSKIEAPGGLEEILRIIRSGSILSLTDP